MEPGRSLLERPDFQLACEHPEVTSCQKIFKFRCGCWDTTHDLVAANAGEHDAISLRSHADCATIVGRTTASRTRNCRKVTTIELEFERLLLANVDVVASAATLMFHLGEVGAFVPVGFGV